jgi:hypothetical protein
VGTVTNDRPEEDTQMRLQPTKTLLAVTAVAALAMPVGAQAAGGADDGAAHLRNGADDAPGHVRHSGDDATRTTRRTTSNSKSRSCKRKRRGSRRTNRVRCVKRTSRVRTTTAHLRHGADDAAGHVRHTGLDDAPEIGDDKGAVNDDAPETGDDKGAVNDDGPNHT